ncbi:MAG: ABC transporter ATP-binding protein [Nitrososphaerales archaeon]
MPEVQIKSLKKKYGDAVALDDVTFTAPDGMFTTILGPSGSGKTTVLRCIAGLEEPEEGEIRIGGKLVYSSSRHVSVPPEDRGIGMVFQSYAIWPHMTVFDNIAYPLKIRGVSKNEIEEKIKESLELVGLQGLEKRLAPNLSGGQQQRVALARALIYQPKVLLLDEPLSNLDARLRERMRIELRDLQRTIKITTIYVTHDRLEAMALSDGVALMRRGQIAAVGTPDDLYNNPPNRFVAGFLCRMNIFSGKQTDVKKNGLTLIETTIGPLYCEVPEMLRNESEVMVSIRRNSIQISKEEQEGDNVLTGRVSSRLFEGDYVEYHVKVGDDIVKVRNGGEEALLRKDEKVYLTMRPEECVVIEKEEVPVPE